MKEKKQIKEIRYKILDILNKDNGTRLGDTIFILASILKGISIQLDSTEPLEKFVEVYQNLELNKPQIKCKDENNYKNKMKIQSKETIYKIDGLSIELINFISPRNNSIPHISFLKHILENEDTNYDVDNDCWYLSDRSILKKELSELVKFMEDNKIELISI